MNGVFVTGSNTEVGKTTVSVEIIKQLRKKRKVVVRKPVETDCELVDGSYFPKDAVKLNEACGSGESLSQVCPYCFELEASPEEASLDAGKSLGLEDLVYACNDGVGEGFVFVEDNYAKNFERLVFRTLEKVKKSPASDKSLIFEHIKQLSLPKYEFTSKDYKNRRLVILSDFLQNSKRFGKDSPSMKTVCTRSKRKNSKWTGACDSFLDFYNVQSKEDQNYLDKMKPDFDKSTVVEMHLLQTCGVKDAKISEELESLWTSYFVWAGVDEKNFELHEPRLVQDSGDENAPCN